ncbi:MAG: hypothetical protein WCN98_16385 [Verrucomicrobiaceae bacterium]
MKHLANKFRNDARVENIQWKIVREPIGTEFSATEVSNCPPDTAHPTLRARFQRLPLLMRLIVIAAILFVLIGSSVIVAKGARRKPDADPDPAESSVPKNAVTVEQWAFLTKDDWPRLMKATGAPGLAEELPKLMSPLEANRKSAQEEPGILSKVFTKQSAKVSISTEDLARVQTRISSWSKGVIEEFELPSEDAIQTAPVLKALMSAKGSTGIEAAAWFRDTMNQRTKYPPDLQRKAKTLENFDSAFPKTEMPDGSKHPFPAEELPARLRKLVAALKLYSKSLAVEGDVVKPFRDLASQELSESTPSLSGYEVLTAKDAHRVEALQRVLGSGAFGMVAFGYRLADEERNWREIRDMVGKGAALAEKDKSDGSRVTLLRNLEKAFAAPAQQIKAPQ